jgi:aryl-alcohol dehydrogenase-like predicted oxidoreductase
VAGAVNRGRFSNPILDALVDEAVHSVDAPKREAMLLRASKTSLVLTWLPAQNLWIVPIPGLEENLGAAKLELTSGKLQDIDSAFLALRCRGPVSGALERRVGR